MTFVLALASAAVYGSADFLGGMASRRTTALRVVAISQGIGLVVVLGTIPLFGPARVMASDLGWGAAAGVCGALGVLFLYRALAIGTMSVVAPLTAVFAAVVPVIVGVLRGERPAVAARFGIALALVAIALVSRSTREETRGGAQTSSRRSIVIALGAGLLIGFFLVALDGASDDAGLWTLAIARVVGLAVLLPLAIPRGLRPPRAAVAPIVGSGVLDMAANILYVLAVMRGMLALVATLVSLYPAATVLLARGVYGERLEPVQKLGVALALGAVALIGWGSG
ncbi:MAG: EamA family transporter [Thermoanaerobaculia bacterium]